MSETEMNCIYELQTIVGDLQKRIYELEQKLRVELNNHELYYHKE